MELNGALMLKIRIDGSGFLLALGKIIIRSSKPEDQPPTAPQTSSPPPPPHGTGDQKSPPAPPTVAPSSPPLPPPPQSHVAAPAPPAPAPPPQAPEQAPPPSVPETKASEPEPPAPPQPKEADAAKAPAPPTAQLPGPLPQPIQEVPAVEKKIREYRYRTRLLKSMLLPMLFGIMSIMMLYNYVNGFEPYFSYHMEIILIGFVVGFMAMSGLVISNIRTARKKGTHPLNSKPGVYLILAFLIPYIALMLVVNPAEAWRFSIGYFFSAIIPPLVVMAYESSAHGKFYVQEEEIDDGLTRNLAFRP